MLPLRPRCSHTGPNRSQGDAIKAEARDRREQLSLLADRVAAEQNPRITIRRQDGFEGNQAGYVLTVDVWNDGGRTAADLAITAFYGDDAVADVRIDVAANGSRKMQIMVRPTSSMGSSSRAPRTACVSRQSTRGRCSLVGLPLRQRAASYVAGPGAGGDATRPTLRCRLSPRSSPGLRRGPEPLRRAAGDRAVGCGDCARRVRVPPASG